MPTLNSYRFRRTSAIRRRRLPGSALPELAEALGVHYQTVRYLERGEYSPGLYLALRIAEFSEVPVEVVFSTKQFPRLGQA